MTPFLTRQPTFMNPFFASVIVMSLALFVTAFLNGVSWAILPSILDAPVELMMTEGELENGDIDSVEQNNREMGEPSVASASTSTSASATSSTGAEQNAPFGLMVDPLTDLTRRLDAELTHSEGQRDRVKVNPSVENESTPSAVIASTHQGITEARPLEGRVAEKVKNAAGSMSSESFLPLESNVLRQSQRIQQQHTDIAHAVRDEDEVALSDIALLWQTAVERSGTIRFAIEKLSRKNAAGDVPKAEGFTNRMLKSLARVGGVAGTVVTGTPAGLVGGSMVEQMLQKSPTTSALTHVTDADMLLLAKEVETLQSTLIERYYDYRHHKTEWTSARASQQELDRYLSLLPSPKKGGAASNRWDPMVPLIESMRTSMDDTVDDAHRGYQSSRQALSLLVGAEALDSLEDVKQHVSSSSGK